MKLDFKTLEALSRLAREHYGLAARCSTAPRRCRRSFRRVRQAGRVRDPPRDRFPEHGLRSPIPRGPQEGDLRQIRANASEERKPKDTDEQFFYKARKKAIGPFKHRMWSIEATIRRRAIGQSLEERFTFLMKPAEDRRTPLAQVSERFVRCAQVPLDREAEMVGRGRNDHRGRKESRRSRRLSPPPELAPSSAPPLGGCLA